MPLTPNNSNSPAVGQNHNNHQETSVSDVVAVDKEDDDIENKKVQKEDKTPEERTDVDDGQEQGVILEAKSAPLNSDSTIIANSSSSYQNQHLVAASQTTDINSLLYHSSHSSKATLMSLDGQSEMNRGNTYSTTTTDPLAPLPSASTTVTTETSIASTSSSTNIASLASNVVERSSNESFNKESKEEELDSFPKPFLCPLTHQLLDDAVVAPDGKTYERQAILATKDYTENQLYPNRALQAIIEETLETSGDTLDANIRRIQKSMRQGISQLLEKSPIPTDEYRPLPDAYYCPITFDLMHVPVIDPEGNTFEKVAIENWIRVNKSSPITRNYLTVDALYPNTAISDLLQIEKSKPEERMHPSVLKWKSEPPPVLPIDNDGIDELPSEHFRLGPYPTTMEELAFRRATRRKLVICTLVGIFCFVLAVSSAVLYGGSCVFVSIWVGCCVRDSVRRLRELRAEERDLRRIHEAQEAREQQLRQAQIEHHAQIQQLEEQLEERQEQYREQRRQEQQQEEEEEEEEEQVTGVWAR